MKLRPDERIAPDFTPVPRDRARHDGWSPGRQSEFMTALGITGSVAASARMVGMSRKSAYALRARPGAESFAEAWDIAVDSGRMRVLDWLMERAIDGVTTITLKTGGTLEVRHGPDRQLVAEHFRAPPPGATRFDRDKVTQR
jgi:hypothetical protein